MSTAKGYKGIFQRLKGERRRIIEQIREEERKRITDHILVNSHTVKEGTFVWTKDILAFINEQ